MKMKRINLILFAIFFSIFGSWAINSVNFGFKTSTDGIYVDVHGICKNVKQLGSNSYFIPTKSNLEWNSFRNNLPSDVVLNSCVIFDKISDASFLGGILGVNGIGDVNGDGYDDYLVHSVGYYRGANYHYAIFFGNSDIDYINNKLTNFNFDTAITYGKHAFSFPNTIEGIGDVNGDGFDDFLIADPEAKISDGVPKGEIFLIYGKKSWSNTQDLESASSASFIGESKKIGSRAGSSISRGGDINGDGFDDFLIGAPGDGTDKSYQKSYLFLGKSEVWSLNENINSAASASFTGDNTFIVSDADDVNGDGFDDFLIGSKKTYLFLGKSRGWNLNQDISSANVEFSVPQLSGSNLNSIFNGIGDVNGDGLGDIVIGQGLSGIYNYHFFFGKNNNWQSSLDLSDSDASFQRIDGVGYEDFLSFEKGGDINGDGFDEVILTNRYFTYYPSVEYKKFLLWGKQDNWKKGVQISNLNFEFFEKSELNSSNENLVSAGDINGDGFDDFFIFASTGILLFLGGTTN